MEITVNGEIEEVVSPLSIQKYIENKGQDPEKVVVEYNGNIVKQKQWSAIELQDGDKLEVLKFMGGGAYNDRRLR